MDLKKKLKNFIEKLKNFIEKFKKDRAFRTIVSIVIVSALTNFASGVIYAASIDISKNFGITKETLAITRQFQDALGSFTKALSACLADIYQVRLVFLFIGYVNILPCKILFLISSLSFLKNKNFLAMSLNGFLFLTAQIIERFFAAFRDSPRNSVISSAAAVRDKDNDYLFDIIFAYRKGISSFASCLGGLLSYYLIIKKTSDFSLFLITLIPTIISAFFVIFYIEDFGKKNIVEINYFSVIKKSLIYLLFLPFTFFVSKFFKIDKNLYLAFLYFFSKELFKILAGGSLNVFTIPVAVFSYFLSINLNTRMFFIYFPIFSSLDLFFNNLEIKELSKVIENKKVILVLIAVFFSGLTCLQDSNFTKVGYMMIKGKEIVLTVFGLEINSALLFSIYYFFLFLSSQIHLFFSRKNNRKFSFVLCFIGLLFSHILLKINFNFQYVEDNLKFVLIKKVLPFFMLFFLSLYNSGIETIFQTLIAKNVKEEVRTIGFSSLDTIKGIGSLLLSSIISFTQPSFYYNFCIIFGLTSLFLSYPLAYIIF